MLSKTNHNYPSHFCYNNDKTKQNTAAGAGTSTGTRDESSTDYSGHSRGGQRAPEEHKDLTFSEYSWWERWERHKTFSETQNLWSNNRRRLVIQCKNKYISQEYHQVILAVCQAEGSIAINTIMHAVRGQQEIWGSADYFIMMGAGLEL